MNNTLHMPGAEKTSARHKFQLGMILVTIGIVYGDIGTSPMYVMKSILEGNGSIGQTDEAFIIGSLSLVIWTITLLTHNLVYLEGKRNSDFMDRDILYSILDKDAKRAEAYWFVSVNVLNEPDTMTYQVETYGTDFIYRITLNLGFKCSPRVNVFLRQIVQDLQESGELPAQDRRYSIYGPSTVGSFKFCIIHKSVTTKTELSSLDELVLHIKYAIRKVAGSKTRWYGLDTSSLILEHVPLITGGGSGVDRIRRIYPK